MCIRDRVDTVPCCSRRVLCCVALWLNPEDIRQVIVVTRGSFLAVLVLMHACGWSCKEKKKTSARSLQMGRRWWSFLSLVFQHCKVVAVLLGRQSVERIINKRPFVNGVGKLLWLNPTTTGAMIFIVVDPSEVPCPHKPTSWSWDADADCFLSPITVVGWTKKSISEMFLTLRHSILVHFNQCSLHELNKFKDGRPPLWFKCKTLSHDLK